MPITAEFVELCRAQITLLTQALGASISVVYLTRELVEGGQAQLVPIAAYPEMPVERDHPLIPPLLPGTMPLADGGKPAQPDSSPVPPRLQGDGESLAAAAQDPLIRDQPSPPLENPGALMEQRQIVLPLMHEEMVFGLLVTRRDDRSWTDWEYAQVEEVARTLAIACVLDQRNGWLEQERQQARLVEMQQQDLMDNLLHQFRNSLTTLQTFGKLILRRLLPGDANREIAENMSWEAERLRDLAQQLEQAVGIWEDTNLASLKDAGELPGILPQDTLKDEGAGAKPMPMLPAGLGLESSLTLQRCLVEMILEPLLASAAAIAQDKGLTIYHSIPEDLPPVWANPQALREVLNNLVENAIKYTPAGGQVVVQAIAPDPSSWLEISVSDTGPGIPPEDLPHLFERHYRGVQAQGAIPGSGLGLAIARTLMEQMHGKIQGFSPALAEKLNIPGYSSRPTQGLGTTFLVKLPVAME